MGVGEGVDLDGEVAEWVVGAGSARAERVVLFAQGGDDVGQGLKRADGLFDEGGDGEEQNERGKNEDADNGGRREMKDEEQGCEQGEDGHTECGAVEAETGLKAEALGARLCSGNGLRLHRHGCSFGTVPHSSKSV